MIQILVRETTIEIAGKEKARIETLPVAVFSDHSNLLQYCEKKGFQKTGSGLESEFFRDMDLQKMKEQVRSYFKIEQPFRLHERFVIFEQELK
ncbi:LA_1064 family peroxide-responsive upregulated protein [Leptospira kirschneri]|uniref:Uncharacterized protein n=1 Tax=Leptospira kirschneri serovar Bulgarica str. Nikolaevo TaxID=1240687 RepID=M6FI15_9LEPT|nr:hypothetical protein [Leptospira kirschneri]EMK22426.1 hypothetical protein LEP1GSC008_1604 [Leptospira kirschneri serovar Bulgarica str. Nikolaevo]EMK24519.1 hypothetical protein LEP1GSC008_2677 [Leptospira kirschneri serovar Bulgarica str. Nikolaevo]EMK24867.1 hypothetical protein LEP1GSC008_0553 [Leptospira kirschneri serovar Bulgarica str. Nikolaevo]